MLKKLVITAAAAAFAAAVSVPALAQGTGTGPVSTICAKEIAKYCAKAGHGNAQTRRCLESHRKQLSSACRQALDNTGRGLGRNRPN